MTRYVGERLGLDALTVLTDRGVKREQMIYATDLGPSDRPILVMHPCMAAQIEHRLDPAKALELNIGDLLTVEALNSWRILSADMMLLDAAWRRWGL